MKTLATYYINGDTYDVIGDEGLPDSEVDKRGFAQYDVLDIDGEPISCDLWAELPTYQEVVEYLKTKGEIT